jgi:hypothetical protein
MAGKPSVPHRIDTSAMWVEMAFGEAAVDRTTAKTQRQQLPTTDHTMLTLSNSSDRPVWAFDVGDIRPRI